MESGRHFKPPWALVRENSEGYMVTDANGMPLERVSACSHSADGGAILGRMEARRG
jgi:hypothetical protein